MWKEEEEDEEDMWKDRIGILKYCLWNFFRKAVFIKDG